MPSHKFKKMAGNSLKYRAKRQTVTRKMRKTARRAVAKYRRAAPKQRTTVTMGTGFPKRLTFTHKYADTTAVSSTAGAINKYIWSTNSLFDPNVTSTGHQPAYFDQLVALYDHYIVIGSRIKFTVTPYTASATGFWIGAFIDDDAVTAGVTGISSLAEQTTGTVVQVAPNANQTYNMELSWSAKKAFGGSILANNKITGTAAASPTEQQSFVFAVQGFTSTDVTVQVKAEVEYIAVWNELKDVAQS